MKETELAQHVVAFVKGEGWEVFQEVIGPAGVADLVLRSGPVLWVIETKMTLGLDVIGQAHRWRSFANLVSVAVPHKRERGPFPQKVLRAFGIGLIEVDGWGNVKERQTGDFLRRRARGLQVCEEQKTHAPAGSASGGHWTPWKGTVDALTRQVRLQPGITPKHAIEKIDHHYSSSTTARACLVRLIRAGVIKSVELRDDGGLYPTEAKA